MVNDDLKAIRDAVRRATGTSDAQAPDQPRRTAQPAARPPAPPQPRWPRPALVALSVLALIIAGVGGGILMLIGDGQATTSETRTEPVQTPSDNPFMSTVDTGVPGVTPTETPAPPLTSIPQQPAQPPLSRQQQQQQQQLPPAQPDPSVSPQPAQPDPSVSPPPAQPTEEPPEIVRVETYREGVLVYFRLFFNDPNDDAQGFGFRGINGSGWAEETHPFSDPSYGRVFPGRVEYPFNHDCGTESETESDVEAWIYDSTALRSTSVMVHLSCTAPSI